MSSRTLAIVAALAAAFSSFAALTPAQMAKLARMQERPTLVGRDTTSVPGAIIERWDPPIINADGEAEYVRTSLVTRVVGELQPTTWSRVRDELEARAAAAEGDASAVREVRKAAKRAQKNLDKVVKALEQAKKKAATDEEIALYDLLLAMLQTEEG